MLFPRPPGTLGRKLGTFEGQKTELVKARHEIFPAERDEAVYFDTFSLVPCASRFRLVTIALLPRATECIKHSNSFFRIRYSTFYSKRFELIDLLTSYQVTMRFDTW